MTKITTENRKGRVSVFHMESSTKESEYRRTLRHFVKNCKGLRQKKVLYLATAPSTPRRLNEKPGSLRAFFTFFLAGRYFTLRAGNKPKHTTV